MTVYVESDFVLQQALQQEQCGACDEILSLAASGNIVLAIPAFSLAEPHQALALKQKARNRLSNELRTHISELGRSKAHRGVQDDFAALASVLIRSAEQGRDGLQRSIAALLRTADVIPLDTGILASAPELQGTLVMSGQDAIVMPSVLRHLLQTTPTESCFLSRNSRDFDDPDVREKLDHSDVATLRSSTKLCSTSFPRSARKTLPLRNRTDAMSRTTVRNFVSGLADSVPDTGFACPDGPTFPAAE